MQNTRSDASSEQGTRYRERLSPSLWVLIGALACAPMAALVLAPLDGTVSLVVGGVVGVLLLTVLVLGSPVVSVTDGELRAGRAHIPVGLLGDPVALSGQEARQARGSGLGGRDWHLFRGGIDGVVIVGILDPDDPTPAWVLSSRTPERLAAAIVSARRRSPRR